MIASRIIYMSREYNHHAPLHTGHFCSHQNLKFAWNKMWIYSSVMYTTYIIIRDGWEFFNRKCFFMWKNWLQWSIHQEGILGQRWKFWSKKEIHPKISISILLGYSARIQKFKSLVCQSYSQDIHISGEFLNQYFNGHFGGSFHLYPAHSLFSLSHKNIARVWFCSHVKWQKLFPATYNYLSNAQAHSIAVLIHRR